MPDITIPIATNQRILVVDDNADVTLILGMLLELGGYLVQTCVSGHQALQLAEERPPQAMLLDISMPDMDGYEVCRRLRQQSWGKAIVVVALTGYGQREDRQRTQDAGFDGHLVKPVDVTALMALLTQLLAPS